MKTIRVTVWNEYYHEQNNPRVREIYPEGIHGCIADLLNGQEDITARTATLDMPEHGLTEEVLAETDVLIWWGHVRHKLVDDEIVDRVISRVNSGMGFIALHSAHGSKPFKRLMGMDTYRLRWREDDEKARFWCVAPGHPIVKGVPETFTLPAEETYGEHFNIPEPDRLIFITWYPGGEVFRSGCCFIRGAGHIFFFQPGHEKYPSYYDENVRKVICNAVRWAAQEQNDALASIVTGHAAPVEPAE